LNYEKAVAVGAQRAPFAMSQSANIAPSAHKMPQLDALRAFAVLSVLFVHFVARPPRWLAIVPWAACGVQLFFVLSGFLITGILLDSRSAVEAGASRLWMLRQFYARRFLRIFPLYYAVILAGWIIKLPGFTESLGWNLAYLTNLYIVLKAGWIGAASHLWTLSVEEQFYLVWPWIVLFLPKRWLLPVFVGVGVFAVGYGMTIAGWFGPWLSLMPFTSFDCFGAGALLALAQRRENEGDPRLRRILCGLGLCAGVPVLILALQQHFPPQSVDGKLAVMHLAMTLLFTPLISGAASGFTGPLGLLLDQEPVQYIGKISYGIYIYHLPVRWVINLYGSNWLKLPWPIASAAVLLIATVVVAALSWHFFECPINRLKRFFPYRDTRGRPSVRVIPGVQPEICPPAKG
jgi:peptidoglycan/LPS O-acetylase OafA/YrhL